MRARGASLALVLAAPLGFGMLAAHAVFLASAWAYNAGLKATAFSIVPFLVSFGIFPSLATLALPDPRLAAGWGWIAGAALGAAVHLTNVLPDLEDDERTGVRGLPHRIGPRASAVVAAIGIVVGAVAVLVGSSGGMLAEVSPLGWVFFIAVLAAAVATAVLALVRPPTRALFRLVMLAALLLAAQLVATGGRSRPDGSGLARSSRRPAGSAMRASGVAVEAHRVGVGEQAGAGRTQREHAARRDGRRGRGGQARPE